MLLRRVAVADPFAVIRNEIDAAFSTLAGRAPSLGARAFPALNVWEDQAVLHVEAELPGHSMDDIEVSVFGDELTIKSAKAGDPADCGCGSKDQSFLRRERFCGQFERTISLPVAIDAERVEASLKHGVLQVTLPKAKAAMPRKISVKGNGA